MDNVIITLDIDWAPDFVIDHVAEQLLSQQVKATWFLTHPSPAVDRLRQHPDLFELGIHPNFLPDSSHGDTPAKVLRYCMDLVPDATSVRTHALVQSTPLLEQIMTQTHIKTDVSLFLPHAPDLSPIIYHWHGRRLIRIPYFWEDDFEIEQEQPSWHLLPLLYMNGLKVFNFHPIHLYLNSATMEKYRALKRQVSQVFEATPAIVDAFVSRGEGTQSIFAELVAHLAANQQSVCVSGIYTPAASVKLVKRKLPRESD